MDRQWFEMNDIRRRRLEGAYGFPFGNSGKTESASTGTPDSARSTFQSPRLPFPQRRGTGSRTLRC